MASLGKSAHKEGGGGAAHSQRSESGAECTWIHEHVSVPLLVQLFTCCVKAWWRWTDWALQTLLFALAGVMIAKSLQSPGERTLKKKKKLLKGKERRRRGKKKEKEEERTGTLCSNGSYAKKQLTKNRQSREEKWGKNKMVWSQADKCTREKFTWLQSSSWRLSQKFMHVYSFSFLFLEEYFAISFYWKRWVIFILLA